MLGKVFFIHKSEVLTDILYKCDIVTKSNGRNMLKAGSPHHLTVDIPN